MDLKHMKSRNIWLTVVFTILAFTSVTYTACKKETSTPTVDQCASVVCQNGGTCFKGVCTCPKGFDGTFCENKWLPQYIGKWSIVETIQGSNRPLTIGTMKNYISVFKKMDGSNYMFLADDFMNNADYDNVSCETGYDFIGSHFKFSENQTIAGSQVSIIKGGGTINTIGDNIEGIYYRVYPDATGAVTDTVGFSGTLQL